MRISARSAACLTLWLAACQQAEDTGKAGPGTDSGGGDSVGGGDTGDSSHTGETGDTSPPPDVEPPSLQITAPLDGGTVSDLAAFSASATDNIGVAAVEFAVDGVSVGSVSTDPYTLSWDSTTSVNGNYQLQATASDGAGNLASASIGFYVENGETSATLIRIINPVDGSTICGDVTVEAAVSADEATVQFILDGVPTAEDGTSPFTWDWGTESTSNGTHTVRALATLADGSQVQNTITVETNNSGAECDNLPSVVITEPTANAYLDGDVVVAATASDDVGVVSVQFFIDNGLLVEDSATPYEQTWDTTAFDVGPHTVKAIATDTSGQTAETRQTVTVDRSPPVVTLLDPLDGDEVSATYMILGSVEEDYALDTVVLRIDGVDVWSGADAAVAYEWDTTTVAGSVAIELQATDRAGHTDSELIDVWVDNPPEVSIDDPNDGDTVSGLVDVEVSASDDLGVDSVEIRLGRDVLATESSSPWSVSFDACDMVAGAYALTATATDSGGNTATDAISITVESPLEVELLDPSGTVDPSETLAARTAGDGTVTSVEWTLDGISLATVVAATAEPSVGPEEEPVYGNCSLSCPDACAFYSDTWDTTSWSAGTYTLTVTATNDVGETASDSTTVTIRYDQDGDGYDDAAYGGDDCDDSDGDVFPGASDVCDGIDNDCNGTADEDFDADSDGYAVESESCTYADGVQFDCDDTDASINPGAEDACDGVDNNCDGYTDAGEAVVFTTDTFGGTGDSTSYTGTIVGNIFRADDSSTLHAFNVYANPFGSIDVSFVVFEATSAYGTYNQVYRSDVTTISGSAADQESPDIDFALTKGKYYFIGLDTDGETEFYYDTSPDLGAGTDLSPVGYYYGASTGSTSFGGEYSSSRLYSIDVTTGGPSDADTDSDGDGWTPWCGDCDDTAAAAYPGAVEVCDGVDDDCDGALASAEADEDGDGNLVCEGDCDDHDPNRSTEYWITVSETGGDTAAPSGSGDEACDGIDNNCDGVLGDDELDDDGDGVTECDGDCDDTDASTLLLTWYLDNDYDDHGAGTAFESCDRPYEGDVFWVNNNDDCDDGDDRIYPGADEVCDGLDNDCNGVDDDVTDADGDGYASTICEDGGGEPDCDDADASTYPGATEVCDGVDQDCDGELDNSAAYEWQTPTFGDSASSSSQSSHFWGNVYVPSTDTYLSSFQQYFDPPSSSTTVYYAVYESATESGDYTEVWSKSASKSGSATWMSSSTIGITLEKGKFYLIGLGVSGTGSFYYDSSPALDPAGVLDPVGSISYTSSGDPSTITSSVSAGSLVYQSFYVQAPVEADQDDDADGYSSYCGDCDDDDGDSYPGATELCDAVDNDCDGAVPAPERDADGDANLVCEGDCDDTNPYRSTEYSTSTGLTATEDCDGIDNDCSGAADATEVDSDGDGSLVCEGDCDDSDASLSPDEPESCDGIDNNCDGYIDVAGADATTVGTVGASSSSSSQSTHFYGNVYVPTTDGTLESFTSYLDPSSSVGVYYSVYEAADSTADYTLVYSASATISGSAGWYDSGALDLALVKGHTYLIGVGSSGTTAYYYDGTPDFTAAADLTPTGWVSYSTSEHPATITTDPTTTGLLYQALSVTAPLADDRDDDDDGWTSTCGDCNDTTADDRPGASERCDGVDNNCDGALPAVENDADADGNLVCEGDCDDHDASRSTEYVGALTATEDCDGVDNDCSGAADASEADADGDGSRICAAECGGTVDTADTGASGGGTECLADCDDTRASVHPGATEVCNGRDDDCVGGVDDDASDGTHYFTDADGDSFGDPATETISCSVLSGKVVKGEDCDDTAPLVSPAATETCDGIDDDCDGVSDEGYDGDGDGAGSCVDCNDGDASVSPFASEVCGDSVDDDCDGFAPACRASGTVDLSTPIKLIGENASDGAGFSARWIGDADGDGLDDLVVGAYLNDQTASAAGAAYFVSGGLSADLDLSLADSRLFGETASDYAGYAVSAAGDVNGDGLADMLIGTYGDDDGGSEAGAAYLVFGPPYADLELASAGYKFVGEDASDDAGLAVAGAGDVSGDGRADIVIAAPYDDDGGSNAGAVYLVFAPVTAGRDLGLADAKLTGDSSSDYAGYSVAGLGDVDGDGLDDLCVGAYGDASSAGAAYVVYGPIADASLSTADAKLTGKKGSDYAGFSVSGAGDPDGDGHADLWVGAYGNDDGGSLAGIAYLVAGAGLKSGVLTGAAAILTGEGSSDYFGYSVSGGGDVDGDGQADVLVGGTGDASGGSGAGAAWLFYGPFSGSIAAGAGVKLIGEDSSDIAGRSVSLPGDFDGDGLADPLIGADGDDDGGSAAGAVYLIGTTGL